MLFNNNTEITFRLEKQISGKIGIINNLGSKIKSYCFNGTEGQNSIIVNVEGIPPGIYYYTLEINNMVVDIKKMVVVR